MEKMRKHDEIVKILTDSATNIEQNGHRMLGRADGIRDVINFLSANKLEIVSTEPIPEAGPNKEPESK